MNKILLIAPAWVGDTVMAQSLFKLLKERNPRSQLHVAAQALMLPLLRRMSEVSSVTALPFTHGRFDLRARYMIGKQLRAEKFDQAIVLPNSFKSALLPWFAKIPKRSGWSRELRRLILNDARSLDKKRYPLMVQRYLALGLAREEVLPSHLAYYPQLNSNPQDQAAVLEKLGLKKKEAPILALCPGAEFGPSKRWPEEAYAEVARAQKAAGWQVWLFGSAKDKPVTERIQALSGRVCEDFAGRTRLDEAIDLLALSSAVVSNDSGLMHIAAALKKPLVAIYGSTSPDFTPPLSHQIVILKENLSCQPCFQRECPLKHHQCMQDLKPAAVLQSLGGLVAV